MPELNYRLAEERDIPALLDLWTTSTSWGSLDEETWRKWYINTPYGPCLIPIAEDERGQVVGQMVFSPAMLSVDLQEAKALRMSAVVLHRSLWGTERLGANDPRRGLYRTGDAAAKAAGVQVLYALPYESRRHAERSSAFALRSVGYQVTEFPCWERQIEPVNYSDAGGLRVSRVESFGEEYDQFWDEIRTQFGGICLLRRGSAWLRFRNGGHLCLEFRSISNGSLQGYIAIRRTDGLIVDALCRRSEPLISLAMAGINWLAETPGVVAEAGFKRVKIMATPFWGDELPHFGFTVTDFRFGFVCRAEAGLHSEAVAPERWHITPGD